MVNRYVMMQALGSGTSGRVRLARMLPAAADASADAPPEFVALKIMSKQQLRKRRDLMGVRARSSVADARTATIAAPKPAVDASMTTKPSLLVAPTVASNHQEMMP